MTLLDPRPSVTGTASAPGGPGSALEQLLGRHAARFPAEHWDREALLVRDAGRTTGLLSLDDVDELLAERGLRAPFVRIARDGEVLAQSAYTSGGGLGATIADQVDPAKVARLLDEGCTVVLQGLHRVWPPLVDLANRLARESGHPVQVNAYLTPPAAQGFAPHYDTHDVLVLQTAGTKHWTVHRPAVAPPQRAQDWSRHREAVAAAARVEPAYDVDLAPGTVLYLPRGWIHAARAQSEMSLHVTIGLHARTQAHVVDAVLAEVRDRVLREAGTHTALPWGSDVGGHGPWLDDAGAAVQRAAASTAEAAARRLAQRRADEVRPPGVRPIKQAQDVAMLPGRLALAPGVGLEVVAQDDGPALLSDGVRLDVRVPALDVPWLQRLSEGESVEVLEAELARQLLRLCVVVAG